MKFIKLFTMKAETPTFNPTMDYDCLNDSPLQVPVILFERAKSSTNKKDKVVAFKLPMDPDNKSSTTYKLAILF